MEVKHICSIRTRLEEHTSKHLVVIHDKYYVFQFNRRNLLTFLYKGDEYFFSNCRDLSEDLDLLKKKDSDALDMWDYYIEDRLSDEMYLSLHYLYYDRKKVFDKLNELKMTLEKLSK